MKLRKLKILIGAMTLLFPVWAIAEGSSYESFLSQVPASPKNSAEAASRWIPDSKSDKLSVDLKEKLEELLKQSGSQAQSGNQKYADMAKQMEGMTQEQKIAAAMKMAKQMQADHQKTLDQTGQSQYAQSYSNLQAGKKMAGDLEKYMNAQKAIDDEFAPKFKKIENDFFTDFHKCPVGITGDPLASCSKPLEEKYHSNYVKLEDEKLAEKAPLLVKLKASLLLKIQSDEKMIATLEKSSNDDAQSQIGMKKMDAIELVQSMVQMTTDMVEEGYEAENTELTY